MPRVRYHYYVYIMSSKRNGTLYIGVTNNIGRRAWEHKIGIISGFTKQYSVHNLVYFETFDDIKSAIKREKQLKNWKREWKISLIESNNPRWDDKKTHCIPGQARDDKNKPSKKHHYR